MLKSTPAVDDDRAGAAARPPVGVAVVGLGYWGPNLLRVLGDNLDVEVRWICDLDTERLAKYRRRHPARASTTRIERVLADPDGRRGDHRHAGAHPLRPGRSGARGGQARVRREAARSVERAGRRAGRAWPASSDRILMCGHTFLYSPPVRAVKRMIEAGDARRHLLHLLEPREPGPAPARRERDLGPRPARLLDPALLARARCRPTVRAVGRDSIVKGIADVAFVTMTFASGIIANVELSWLAPSKLRRTVLVGQRADGRSTTTAPASRSGCSIAASSTATPRRSASTTSPIAAATSSRRRSSPTSRSGSSSPTSSGDPRRATGWSSTRRSRAAWSAWSRPPTESLRLGGHEVSLAPSDIGQRLASRRDLALA